MRNPKKWFPILCIFCILGIPFAFIYYLSADSYNERYKNWYQGSEEAHRLSHSRVTTDQVLLLKDEKVLVDRTCLVFKNENKNDIRLDLHLLDFDPGQSYPLCILKKNSKKEFWVGTTRYRIISVNKRFLKLRILDRHQMP